VDAAMARKEVFYVPFRSQLRRVSRVLKEGKTRLSTSWHPHTWIQTA